MKISIKFLSVILYTQTVKSSIKWQVSSYSPYTCIQLILDINRCIFMLALGQLKISRISLEFLVLIAEWPLLNAKLFFQFSKLIWTLSCHIPHPSLFLRPNIVTRTHSDLSLMDYSNWSFPLLSDIFFCFRLRKLKIIQIRVCDSL